MARPPLPTWEVVASSLGGVTWLLGACCGLIALSGRNDQGLDGLGTGLLFLAFAGFASACAVLTLGTLVVAGVQARGRLRGLTCALAILPACAGAVVLVHVLKPDERHVIPVRPMPSIEPVPSWSEPRTQQPIPPPLPDPVMPSLEEIPQPSPG